MAPLVGSIRISNGASKRKLNPRSGESNCSEETPRSTRMPVGSRSFALSQHLCDGAKVGLKGAKSFSERRQSLPGVIERRRVEIHSDYASVTGGFQNRFAVSAKPNRAIYKETSSLRSEELQCLF